MWFRRIGRRLAAFGKIGVGVAAIHLITLIALVIHHFVSPSKPPGRPLAVRMLKQSPSPRPEAPKPIKTSAPPKPAKKSVAPPKKTAPAPPREIKQSAPVPSPPPRKAAPEIRLPSFIESTPVETAIETIQDNRSYAPFLAAFFQEQLQLPEIGEVKARITLEAPGRIASVEILDTRSGKNAEWLKIQLPLLTPPCFNDFNISDAKLEFTITFRNVEKI